MAANDNYHIQMTRYPGGCFITITFFKEKSGWLSFNDTGISLAQPVIETGIHFQTRMAFTNARNKTEMELTG